MLYKFMDCYPTVDDTCFVAKSADIIGNVFLEESVSVWFNAVLRGDTNYIHIGKGSNIQDNCVVHVNKGETPAIVGEYSSIGHNVTLHGCSIGNNCLVGMGSIVMDGAIIGDNTIIGAGSLITGGKKIPSGVLVVGSPGKVIRKLSENEIESLKKNADGYINIAKQYLEGII